MDWLGLLAVQGTLNSLLQHHSSKASILQRSAFFMVRLSHLYMTTGKPWFWLYGRWLAKWCLCSLIHWFVSSFLSKKQASFNFMAEVTIHSDFRTKEEICHCFYLFPFCLPWNGVILAFLILSFKPEFSFFSFTFIKRLFHSSSFSAL